MTPESQNKPTSIWDQMSLATRYGLVSGAVFIVATLIIGSFIVGRIEESVVRNSANATAHFMDSVLSPVSNQLAESGTLSPGARRALDEIFENTPLGDRVASYKIWSADGMIIASSNKSIEGQTFKMTENLVKAWQGEVMADFEKLDDTEDQVEASLGLPLLEIYSPIHEAWSGRTAAVAEFYEINSQLRDDLDAARISTWLTVSAVSLTLGGILYVIVLGGSRTIVRQQLALDDSLSDLRRLSARNTELRLRVQRAAGRTAASQEETMRRIGADLHDGPAQDLAYAALRIDSLTGRKASKADKGELEGIKRAIDSALTEVRSLSRGLSLPQIANLALPDIITRVAEAHKLRSGGPVTLNLNCTTEFPLSEALRICVFRFVQEGLNNASRHAVGAAISIELDCDAHHLRLAVLDGGPGLSAAAPPQHPPSGSGLGLIGLRDRVESLGGTFRAESQAGSGAILEMTLETGG